MLYTTVVQHNTHLQPAECVNVAVCSMHALRLGTRE